MASETASKKKYGANTEVKNENMRFQRTAVHINPRTKVSIY